MKKNKIQAILIVLFIIVFSETWTSSCIGMLHKVKRGETLSGIARKYDVPMKSIAQTNSITSMIVYKSVKSYLSQLLLNR